MAEAEHPKPSEKKPTLRDLSPLRMAITFVMLFLLYWAFAGQLGWAEGTAGVVAALAGTGATLVVRLHANVRFFPRPGDVVRIGKPVAKVLTDTGLVFATLFEWMLGRPGTPGRFITIRFDAGGADLRSAARRALVVAGMSLPPNTFVVTFDARKGEMIVHELHPTAEPPGGGDRQWPL